MDSTSFHFSRRRHRATEILAGLLLAVAGPLIAAQEASQEGGRPLAEVLLELQKGGLPLVFTSEVVRPEMRVEEVTPVLGDPRDRLRAILEPHGLEAREGPGGVLVIVVAGPAHEEPAAAPFEEARPYVDDEIFVQPSRVSLLEDPPEGPFTFGRDEIERLPHLGGDVFRAMPLAPGTATNDVTARFNVRGGRSDEVLVRLDGQELYEPYHLKDYDSALSIVPTDTLASVTLTTGGFPVSRGDRMGGVLDLTTDVPAGPWGGRVGAGLLSVLATSAGSLPGDRGGWLATGRRGSAELAEELIGDENPRFWDAFVRVDLEIAARQSLRAHGLAASDSLDFHETVDGEEKLFQTRYDSRYGWISHDGLIGDSLFVETTASWTDVTRDRRGVEQEEEGFFEVRDSREMEVRGLAQSWSFQARPAHLFQAGWEARRFETRFDYENQLERELVIAAPFAPSPVSVPRFREARESDHGSLWISERWSGHDRLTAEGGLRWDRHTLTDETLWSPRLNLAWRVGERGVLRGSWGRFHQSQRPYELLVEDGETRIQASERADHWVLGFERSLASPRAGLTAFRAEAFHREIDRPRTRYVNLLEPINTFPEIEPDRVRIDPEESSAYGLELLLRGAVGERATWWVAYTWSRSEDLLGGRWIPRALDQPHALVADLAWRLGRHWDLNLAWHLHTGWPTTPVHVVELDSGPDEPEAPEDEGPEEDALRGAGFAQEEGPELGLEFGVLHSRRLPTYHRLDLRLSRSWFLRRSELSAFVDVQNLYDRRNVGGFDPGLDEEAGIAVLEPEPWPGILPSVGIVWEF
jgi:outer membrane receptor protein involved in Fe transport